MSERILLREEIPYEEHLEELANLEKRTRKHYEAQASRLAEENRKLTELVDLAVKRGFLDWEETI